VAILVGLTGFRPAGRIALVIDAWFGCLQSGLVLRDVGLAAACAGAARDQQRCGEAQEPEGTKLNGT